MKRSLLTTWIVFLVLITSACGAAPAASDRASTPAATATATPAPAVPSPATGSTSTPAPAASATPASGAPGDAPQVGEMPVEERMAALEEATAYLNALPAAPGSLDHQAVADYLSALPQFVASGVSADGTVWARFVDGPYFFVFDNRPAGAAPEVGARATAHDRGSLVQPASLPRSRPTAAHSAAATVPGAQAAAQDLPGSDQVRLLNGLGSYFTVSGPTLEDWFSDSAYNVIAESATIEALKKVSGDGVFYIETHAGMVPGVTGDTVYGLWTATPINPFNETLYWSDIAAGRIHYAAAAHDTNPAYDPEVDSCPPGDTRCQRPYLFATNYAITPAFVEEYMSFAQNSLVFISACSSWNGDMERAFRSGSKVSIYAGWSASVHDGFANQSTLFLFDRWMGLNKREPNASPPLRPFDRATVEEAMRKANLIADPNGGAQLRFSVAGSLTLLMPSIKYLEVSEATDELFIYGLFGTKEGTVTVNGSSAAVLNWGPETISVRTSDGGSGAAGEVVVKVREHESNPVPLTEWRGTVTYRANADQLASGLLTVVDMEVHFRADVHAYREVPWEDPVDRTVRFVLAGDSQATWSMSGASRSEGAEIKISGSGSLQTESDQPDHDQGHFELSGTLNVQGMREGKPPAIEDANFHLHVTSSAGVSKLTITMPGVSPTETHFPILTTDALYDRTLDFDEQYNIVEDSITSGTIRGMETLGSATIEWGELKANHAPSLDDPPPG